MTLPGRNGWIDGLRGLSAVAVALFHFNRIPTGIPPDRLSGAWHSFWLRGYWGVGVFFALSGFCLYPGWSRSADCLDFLRRRAVRIFPPYWGSLLLVAGVALAAKLLTGVNDTTALPRQPLDLVATALLLTTPVSTVPTINWVYWTLSCIIAFYLVMGFVLLGPSAGRISWLVGLHLLFCLVDAGWPPPATGPLFFVRYWPVFGVGLALAVAQQHRLAGCTMLTASFLHAAWLLGHGADQAHFVAVGGVTTALLALCRDRIFPAALLACSRIGEISYSLYLVHVPVGVYALTRFLPGKFTRPAAYIGCQLLLLAASLAVAKAFYFAAERPFLPQPAPAPLA